MYNAVDYCCYSNYATFATYQTQDAGEGEGKGTAPPREGSSKKRRRDERTKGKDKAKEDDVPASAKQADQQHRKQIVRIRAKVHCTAAGLPGVDAPVKSGTAEALAKDTAGDDASNLPHWHPLAKVGPCSCKHVVCNWESELSSTIGIFFFLFFYLVEGGIGGAL